MADIFEQITGVYDQPDTKQCTTCWEVKDLDEFYTSETGRFGRRASCAECQTLAALDRYYAR